MLDTKGLLTVKQYADYRKVSRHTVYKYVRNGKIQQSVYTVDGKAMIDPAAADVELSQNLDQIFNPPGRRRKGPMPKTWFYQGQDRKTAERIQAQESAADLASEGEEPGPGGYLVPEPIWDSHYIVTLFHLDPDRVEIERITKTEWRLKVHDLDTESGEPCPWHVELSFDYHPDT